MGNLSTLESTTSDETTRLYFKMVHFCITTQNLELVNLKCVTKGGATFGRKFGITTCDRPQNKFYYYFCYITLQTMVDTMLSTTLNSRAIQ